MTIKAITIQNFKGIAEAIRVELKPITLLFGANSAGKSTVLQALLYAREILARRNTDPDRTELGGDHVDLGGFRNLIHNHDQDLRMALGFELDLSGVDLVDYADIPQMRVRPTSGATTAAAYDESLVPADDPVFSAEILDQLSAGAATASILLTVNWSEIKDEPVQADYEVSINGEAAARIRTDPATSTQHVLEFNENHPWFNTSEEPEEATAPIASDSNDVTTSSTPVWHAVSLLEVDLYRSTGRTPETLIDEIADTLEHFDLDECADALPFCLIAPAEYLLSQLNALRYLGPIREVPSRTYHPALSPDVSRWANGLGAWDWIQLASRDQLADLNAWLTREDRLNTGYRVDVRRFKELITDSMLMLGLMDGAEMLDNYSAIKEQLDALPVKSRVVLRQEADFLEVSPQDVGIGISQVIPVVVSALDAGDRLTVIEQPELHIHPAIQVALGDLFIQSARSVERTSGPHLLIETHSEHLLLRLLRRIRETSRGEAPKERELTPEQVAVYFVEATREGTVIRPLALDDRGGFQERWPKGFFEEREEEIFGPRQDLKDEIKKVFGE